MFTNIIIIGYIALIFIYIISEKKQFNKKIQGLCITLGILFYLLYIIYYIKTFHTFPIKPGS
jgi:phosphoglycerol transferase MdoB-like AlkP superfamily enzyme